MDGNGGDDDIDLMMIERLKKIERKMYGKGKKKKGKNVNKKYDDEDYKKNRKKSNENKE